MVNFRNVRSPKYNRSERDFHHSNLLSDIFPHYSDSTLPSISILMRFVFGLVLFPGFIMKLQKCYQKFFEVQRYNMLPFLDAFLNSHSEYRFHFERNCFRWKKRFKILTNTKITTFKFNCRNLSNCDSIVTCISVH